MESKSNQTRKVIPDIVTGGFNIGLNPVTIGEGLEETIAYAERKKSPSEDDNAERQVGNKMRREFLPNLNAYVDRMVRYQSYQHNNAACPLMELTGVFHESSLCYSSPDTLLYYASRQLDEIIEEINERQLRVKLVFGIVRIAGGYGIFVQWDDRLTVSAVRRDIGTRG